MIEYADIVCGLAWGDEAKGKITSELARSGEYDFVCRWAGGNNAGHTVFVDGKKYKTHLIPSGVFHGVTSVIGPGCVVHENSLMEEIRYLEKNGFDISKVKVSPRAHIVSRLHIDEDTEKLAKRLGTTSKGIAPCYADKMARKGILAKDAIPYWLMWDENLSGKVLCEGAQGIWLDVDFGNYPYVTSSTTLPHGACSLGFPVQMIRNIWGAAKVYDTRSGVDPLFPESLLNDPELMKIGDLGHEFGVTTGRRRKVNWLNLNKLIKAINLTGTTHIVLSKTDVVESAKLFKLHYNEHKVFNSLTEMTTYISDRISESCPTITKIKFSNSPTSI
tara:strand:+ start:1885 stop:2880 length:996 start_codon:yes stop_codon:yes gene_type:complete